MPALFTSAVSSSSSSSYAPHQYIQIMRLKHAEILIKTTNLSIAEIGERSSFTRTDYFSAAFKKRYQVSPSAYKKQCT